MTITASINMKLSEMTLAQRPVSLSPVSSSHGRRESLTVLDSDDDSRGMQISDIRNTDHSKMIVRGQQYTRYYCLSAQSAFDCTAGMHRPD